MYRALISCLTLCGFLCCSSVDALSLLEGHELSVRPALAYFDSSHDDGSDQSGFLYGGQLDYCRWADCGLYLKAEAYHLTGSIDGRDASADPFESDYDESWFAAALGWSLGARYPLCMHVAPYLIYGRYYSENTYEEPTSPLLVLKNSAPAAGVGLAARLGLCDCATLGFDTRCLIMWDGESRTDYDPVFGTFYLPMNQDIHAYVSMPFVYTVGDGCVQWDLEFVPYYWYRSFGSKSSQPRSFVGTEHHHYGVTAGVSLKL